mmetsp:Transcript_52041/g.167421  ORF Transcript_52041/g.167421 Transcript_52041/m.167421 type:complete len:85 (-) Transcript_52041:74-328(-)
MVDALGYAYVVSSLSDSASELQESIALTLSACLGLAVVLNQNCGWVWVARGVCCAVLPSSRVRIVAYGKPTGLQQRESSSSACM